ncbi:unnamed protein product [Rotaria magnacalcarata]
MLQDLVGMSKDLMSGFSTWEDLANYFANNASDHICDKCSMLISRQIKISDCPIVIILKVNDIKNSTNLSYKPPLAVCFYPLLDDSFIGCASSSVYDIATAVSASILIQFNQPISVRLLNKCTN